MRSATSSLCNFLKVMFSWFVSASVFLALLSHGRFSSDANFTFYFLGRFLKITNSPIHYDKFIFFSTFLVSFPT